MVLPIIDVCTRKIIVYVILYLINFIFTANCIGIGIITDMITENLFFIYSFSLYWNHIFYKFKIGFFSSENPVKHLRKTNRNFHMKHLTHTHEEFL